MKKGLLIILIALVLPLGVAWAQPPISLSHTLTGYTAGTDAVTLDYTLHVENSGDTPVDNLTLSYVPFMIISTEEATLNIGSLAAYGSTDVSFSFVTPMLLGEEEFLMQPFFWAGEFKDVTGNLIEFPAESRHTPTGGAL